MVSAYEDRPVQNNHVWQPICAQDAINHLQLKSFDILALYKSDYYYYYYYTKNIQVLEDRIHTLTTILCTTTVQIYFA